RGLDPELSRELAQDTMLRAYGGFGDFEGRSHLRTWLLRIATNLWKNWVRDYRGTCKRGRWESSLEQLREEGGLEVAEINGFWPARASDPERRALEREAGERVRSHFSVLPLRQRECLRLWLDGSFYEEIADELGVSIQTVRASLSRAKSRLAEDLGPEFRGRALQGEGS
ncbi:MAG: sigma-70 family RNA polymerase sigma factor, partial [bacterium]|nr:sigma-70 family RNA polymerase sigma factor [bacterium]